MAGSGSLAVDGSGTAPVVFTSVNDNTVGGATGSGSPAPGDYFAAIDVDGGGSVDVTDASFSYAQDGIGPGAGANSALVSVSGGSFDHDDQGVDLGAQEGAGTGSLSVSGAEFAGDQTGVVTEGWGLALSGSRFTGSAVAAVIAEGVPDLSKVVLAGPGREYLFRDWAGPGRGLVRHGTGVGQLGGLPGERSGLGQWRLEYRRAGHGAGQADDRCRHGGQGCPSR